MKNYYTAAEAYKKLNIPRSTFYHLIKTGEIPAGIHVPLRKQALYRKEEIDKIAEERARYLEELKQEPDRLKFMLPSEEDLIQLVDIDRMVFHEETLIFPEDQLKRLKYNPEVIHVLKDCKTGEVVGGITLSPLKHDVLQKLINLEIGETKIKPEDYRPYSTEQPQDCCLVGIIARPGIAEKYYASRLIHATLNYLIELLERGVIIRRIYTVATTEDGDKLARDLHFTRLPGEWQGEHEDFRHPYVLYLDVKESKSVLINKYLKHKKNLERRRKRYEKQLSNKTSR
ncbi:MAG: helix-turn-helix domain-containing protein [Ktedonobacteraceae bacterium]|nr:helix-turn-helix domain-containing protein [Ktedonobacteraceae bacterium]